MPPPPPTPSLLLGYTALTDSSSDTHNDKPDCPMDILSDMISSEKKSLMSMCNINLIATVDVYLMYTVDVTKTFSFDFC